ncbi:hypothetical protein M0802_008550 [Mischocyttarus mexicanus]|nr:hypothetical protein M0802_008550 [Mischocyttarus mexicanus]
MGGNTGAGRRDVSLFIYFFSIAIFPVTRICHDDDINDDNDDDDDDNDNDDDDNDDDDDDNDDDTATTTFMGLSAPKQLHSEYRSTYTWHEYTGPQQEHTIVRRAPQPPPTSIGER